jgi:hypothetical protein
MMQLLPMYFIRQQAYHSFYLLAFDLKVGVSLRAEEAAEDVGVGLLVEVLRVLDISEDSKTVLVGWEKGENVLLLVVQLNQCVNLC